MNRDEVTRLRGSLLGFYAGADDSIPLQEVHAFKSELDGLGKTSTIKVYDTAKRGFGDPTAATYDSAAAVNAWERTIVFLSRYLRG